jgi:hypothetical protein
MLERAESALESTLEKVEKVEELQHVRGVER